MFVNFSYLLANGKLISMKWRLEYCSFNYCTENTIIEKIVTKLNKREYCFWGKGLLRENENSVVFLKGSLSLPL